MYSFEIKSYEKLINLNIHFSYNVVLILNANIFYDKFISYNITNKFKFNQIFFSQYYTFIILICNKFNFQHLVEYPFDSLSLNESLNILPTIVFSHYELKVYI